MIFFFCFRGTRAAIRQSEAVDVKQLPRRIVFPDWYPKEENRIIINGNCNLLPIGNEPNYTGTEEMSERRS